MLRYVLKRLLQMIPVLIGVSLVVFFISSGNPDAVILQILGDGATDQQIAELVEELGYNKPVIVRYLDWLAGLLHGDLGRSHINNRDVWEAFMQTLPVTIRLSCLSVLVSIAISLPLGILSAMKNGTLIDNGSMVVALLGLATPNFWLGLMLIIFFSNQLGWFPSGGVRDGFMSYILPAITVGTGMTANLTRQTRSSMLDVIRADYLRTARAKGVSERRVILHHALRNALIPIITVIGGQVAATLAGSALTETVFAMPGVGRLIVDSVNKLDVNMITGCVSLKAMITATIMLVVDLLYALVDPRIKAQFVRGGKSRG